MATARNHKSVRTGASRSESSLSDSEESGRLQGLVPLLIILALAAVLLENQGVFKQRKRSLEKSKISEGKKSDRLDDYLDKQMQDVAKMSELNALKIELDNRRLAPAAVIDASFIHSRERQVDQGYIGEVSEDNSGKVFADVSGTKKYNSHGDPVLRMDSILQHKLFTLDYDKRSREEFVRQLIENAERDGFHLSINDKLEVVAIQPIATDVPLRLPRRVDGSVNKRPDPFDPRNSGSH